jgi:sterol desaturase/sphingolipid hydroxylase (fatty acid hydroxylase superfamily)
VLSPSAQFVIDALGPSTPVLYAVLGSMAVAALLEVAWLRRRGGYPWNQLKATLVGGAAASVWFALSVKALEPLYAWLSRHAMFELRLDSFWSWAGLVLLVDLGYYAHHRLAHRVRWMWLLHTPHHSVRQVTLINALRLSWSEATVGWLLMNVPAVLLGFPPQVVPTIYVLIGAYQFWIHCSVVPKLGPLEWLLATPSHHRVHHSTEPQHLDRNFGGLLIVFDRLFGTFASEGERPPAAYGLVGRPPDTLREVFLREVARLRRDTRAAEGWVAKLKIAFGPP